MHEITATDVSSWQSAASQAFVPLVCTPLEARFGARLATIQLSEGIYLSHVRSGSLRVERTEQLARHSDTNDLLLSLQLDSTGMVHQHGRTARLQPGTAALYEVNQPYILEQPQTGQDLLVLRIPRGSVGMENTIISNLCGRTIDQSVPGLTAFFGYLHGIVSTQVPLHNSSREQLGRIGLDLLRLTLRSFAGQQPTLWNQNSVLLESAKNYIQKYLSNPELSVHSIAHAHNVSTRKLYEVFSSIDQTPAAYLRTLRLQRAKELLATHHPGDRSVASIAAACGFNDASTFTRAFTREFGSAPTHWIRKETTLRSTTKNTPTPL